MSDFIVELIALVVMVYVIWRYVVPPVRKLMRNQQEAIRLQVEGAKAAHERLSAADLKFQEAVAEARTEAAKIRDAARADAQRIGEEMREYAQREVERIRQRGQDELETQRQQVIRELRQRIGELAVTTATELVTTHLSDDTRRVATVDRLLDELDAMTGAAPSSHLRKHSAPAASGKGGA
jgi:F-type H+-transporting ATPase subunit b